MFLFLSFIVAFIALYLLSDVATSYHTSEPNAAAIVTLLIYSLVCIIKEIREKAGSFFGDDDYYNGSINSYNNTHNHIYDYDSYYSGSYTASNRADNHNDWIDKFGSRKVEVFAPNKKEKIEEERPKVLHYPSKQETREKIAELEKSRLWRMKRSFCAFMGRDITEKYYQPSYVKEEVAVKGGKEDHSRYMPNQSWITKKEEEEYSNIIKSLGRSCDIAFDGENFVDEITITNNDKRESEHCNSSVINIR